MSILCVQTKWMKGNCMRWCPVSLCGAVAKTKLLSCANFHAAPAGMMVEQVIWCRQTSDACVVLRVTQKMIPNFSNNNFHNDSDLYKSDQNRKPSPYAVCGNVNKAPEFSLKRILLEQESNHQPSTPYPSILTSIQ